MSYKIRLEVFEGPLDLLLYLIKKEELNIYDIPITRITEQYLEYLGLMEMMDLDVAGEFLLMAASLMQIKSRMLLPPDPEGIETDQEDPRAELVRRLLEYKAFKEAAEKLRHFEGQRSGVFSRLGVEPQGGADLGGLLESSFFDVSLFELMTAFSKVLNRLPKASSHEVVKDQFSVADKMHAIFHYLVKEPVIYFSGLFRDARNRYEVITTFLALLELIKQREVAVIQNNHFEEIEIRRNLENERSPRANS